MDKTKKKLAREPELVVALGWDSALIAARGWLPVVLVAIIAVLLALTRL
ncbi:hypothetical protein LMIY3S_03648 [Labrys miyagiensis]